jgi:23S rRNA (cytosine1962-C5)-methyltransferase
MEARGGYGSGRRGEGDGRRGARQGSSFGGRGGGRDGERGPARPVRGGGDFREQPQGDRHERPRNDQREGAGAHRVGDPLQFASLLGASIAKRRGLIVGGKTDAFRLFGGEADGFDGIYVDRYGPACTLITYEGRVPESLDVQAACNAVLEATRELGVRAVYHKPFAKDRSRLGGMGPDVLTNPTPGAGEALDEFILVREHQMTLEVRLYDGFSTGLFLDQRENRRFLADWISTKKAVKKPGWATEGDGAAGLNTDAPRVLNMFAYTCAFSVACAMAGAATTSVDVSGKYLDWGKRNFVHSGQNPDLHRFARMDSFEFLRYAKRKELAFELIILDPPSFSTANKRKKIPAWSSTDHYGPLIREAMDVLAPGGAIFASTNTRELCMPGRFDRMIEQATGYRATQLELPGPPQDFARERERFAARMFGGRRQ